MGNTLKDYSWDLGEYMPRASQAERGKLTMQDAFKAYQLIPSPMIPDGFDPNDYIRMAQETHELKYIFFYLHANEPYFNERINTFLSGESDRIHPTRFMDLKLECRLEVLQRFPAYDPGRGVKFTTYIHRYITDTLLRFRLAEEYHTFDSLQEYKDARRIMQLYAECTGNADVPGKTNARRKRPRQSWQPPGGSGSVGNGLTAMTKTRKKTIGCRTRS